MNYSVEDIKPKRSELYRLVHSSDRLKEFDYSIVKKELGSLEIHGLYKYLLDIKKSGIKVKNTSNSTVAYIIGITDDRPTGHVNYKGGSLPDVDTDVSMLRRQEVLSYMKRKYGFSKVAQIGTYNYLKAKSAIRTVARVLGYDLSVAEKIVKLIPPPQQGVDWTIEELLKIDSFVELYRKDSAVKEIVDLSKKLEGIISSRGKHAAGILIYPEPIVTTFPAWRDGDLSVLEYDMKEVEELGGVKLDLLGLKTLDIIDLTIKFIKKYKNIDIKIEDIDVNDPSIYSLLSTGKLMGIFQLEGEAISNATRNFIPEKITDISLISAGFRPGAMAFLHSIIALRNNRIPEIEPHQDRFPILKDILSETYGYMIYQEQIMEMAKKLAGFNEFEADDFRKAVAKKDNNKLIKLYPKLEKGLAKNGLTKSEIEQLKTEIQDASKYMFNKSHSMAYSIITAYTAWLKANYTEEFFAANMTIEFANVEKISEFIEEAKTFWGIKVLPPSINNAEMEFSVGGKNIIIFGFSGLKGVSRSVGSEIINERNKNGHFKNLSDFIYRTGAKKNVVESLIKSGAFDTFYNRSSLLNDDYVKNLIFVINNIKKKEINTSIFQGKEYLAPKVAAPYTKETIIRHEIDTLDTWITVDMAEVFGRRYDASMVVYVKDTQPFKTGKGGKVICTTSKGLMTVFAFKKVFNEIKELEGEFIAITINNKRPYEEDDPFYVIEKFEQVSPRESFKDLHLNLDDIFVNIKDFNKIKNKFNSKIFLKGKNFTFISK